MLTFSQMVDEVASQTGRVDKTSMIAGQVNQTVREIHATKEGNAVFYPRNLVEDQITATLTEAQNWTPPDFHQQLRTVRYDSVTDSDGEKIWPKMLRPGAAQREQDWYYYRAGVDFYFVGYGGVDALISLAYYLYPFPLKYFPVGNRPATYDYVDGWTYYNLTSATPIDLDYTLVANQPAARALVTNWPIFDWFDNIIEGVKGKTYKAVGDVDRARSHFAQYSVSRGHIITAEGGESLEM